MSKEPHAAGTADANMGYKHGLQPVSGAPAFDTLVRRLGTAVRVEPMTDASAFVVPQSIFYELDGRTRRWDMVQSHSSVGIVLYHTQLQALLLVRQFRPAVYATMVREAREAGAPDPPLAAAFTYELCAGILDKGKSLAEIAREEVLEECGYRVPLGALAPITAYRSAMGISGSRHSVFWAQVDESMRVDAGGGLRDTGEAIEVLALPLSCADAFMADEACPKSAGLLFGLMWLRARMASAAGGSSAQVPAAVYASGTARSST